MNNPKIALRMGSPCPCGSGRELRACHYDPIDNQVRRPIPKLGSGGQTGFSHAGCYLRDTHDCSEQISREHYVSAAVLKKLGEAVRLSGAHWMAEGESLQTRVGNLTAKILCRRHNEMLSPLDKEAAIFFEVLSKVLTDLKVDKPASRPRFHLASGEALELWLLKVACGHYFGIGSADGVPLRDNYSFDLEAVRSAFFERTWMPRAGLYFKGKIGDRIATENSINVGALLNPSNKFVAGVTLWLLGLNLDVIFNSAEANPREWEGRQWRPTELVWKSRTREHHIILSWPVGQGPKSVTLSAT